MWSAFLSLPAQVKEVGDKSQNKEPWLLGRREVTMSIFHLFSPCLPGRASWLDTGMIKICTGCSNVHVLDCQKLCCVFPIAFSSLLFWKDSLILISLCVFLVTLVVGDTDRGVWDSYAGPLGSKADCGMWHRVHRSLHMVSDGTLSGGFAALLFLKASRPSVQATKPSLVILADRKEWMMKTIGLGQEWRSSWISPSLPPKSKYSILIPSSEDIFSFSYGACMIVLGKVPSCGSVVIENPLS